MIRPRAALEEGTDDLEDTVDGLLHLEGEGVAVDPKNDEGEALAEVSKVCEVRSNTCRALQTNSSHLRDTMITVKFIILKLVNSLSHNEQVSSFSGDNERYLQPQYLSLYHLSSTPLIPSSPMDFFAR